MGATIKFLKEGVLVEDSEISEVPGAKKYQKNNTKNKRQTPLTQQINSSMLCRCTIAIMHLNNQMLMEGDPCLG